MSQESAEALIARADWLARRKRSARIVATLLALWCLCGLCVVISRSQPWFDPFILTVAGMALAAFGVLVGTFPAANTTRWQSVAGVLFGLGAALMLCAPMLFVMQSP